MSSSPYGNTVRPEDKIRAHTPWRFPYDVIVLIWSLGPKIPYPTFIFTDLNPVTGFFDRWFNRYESATSSLFETENGLLRNSFRVAEIMHYEVDRVLRNVISFYMNWSDEIKGLRNRVY